MLILGLTEPPHLELLYRFRYDILVKELRWLSSDRGKILDEYDMFAYNYAAFDEDRNIVGSIRVVHDGPLGLPLERLNSLDFYRGRKHLVEFCRLAVARQYRNSRLPLKLMAAAYQCADLTGGTHVVLDAFLEEEALYTGLAFKRISEPYSDPQYNCNSQVVTMATHMKKAISIMKRDRPAVYRMLTQNDKSIIHGELCQEIVLFEEPTFYWS